MTRTHHPDWYELSKRERDVVALLATHYTQAHIARQLHVSINTVKTHVAHIYGKLGVTDRGDAVSKAVELGLLDRDGHLVDFDSRDERNDRFVEDPILAAAVRGAARARERALAHLLESIREPHAREDVGPLVARRMAFPLRADYASVAFIDHGVMRVTYHGFLEDEVGVRSASVPLDPPTPLAAAALSRAPVVLRSLAGFIPKYRHIVNSAANAGVVATICYPVVDRAAIGVAWSDERPIDIDFTLSALAQISCALSGGMGRHRRATPRVAS